IRWEDGVDAVYWAAMFAKFGVAKGMELVAETHKTVWTEDQKDHFTSLLELLSTTGEDGLVFERGSIVGCSSALATVMEEVHTLYGPISLHASWGALPTQHLVAAAAGGLRCLRVLLDHYPVDLFDNCSEIFRSASWNGHAVIV
ncbi:hypothetical protein HDU96_002034, partial [Phlyctochytrium bullatum]